MGNRPLDRAEVVELVTKAGSTLASLVAKSLDDRGVSFGNISLDFTAVITAELPVLPDPKVTIHARVSLVPGATRPQVTVTDGVFTVEKA